jgi:hypothetical protein
VKLVTTFSAKIEKLEADRACCSYEGDAEDILVLEMDVFGSPSYDEEVISNTDQEKPSFDEYPNEDDEERSFSKVYVYDDCESDPWESHVGEMEELNVQLVSSPELVKEPIPTLHFVDLGSSQPAYDSYESDSDVDMKDFQDHTIEPSLLYIKEKCFVEIIHPGLIENTEQHVKEKHPFINIHEEASFPQLANVVRENKGGLDQQSASAFPSPVLATDI